MSHAVKYLDVLLKGRHYLLDRRGEMLGVGGEIGQDVNFTKSQLHGGGGPAAATSPQEALLYGPLQRRSLGSLVSHSLRRSTCWVPWFRFLRVL